MRGAWLIVTLSLAQLFAMLGLGAMPAALPELLRAWRLGTVEAATLLAAYFAGAVLFVPVTLWLIRLIGPRQVFLTGSLLTVLSATGVALLAGGLAEGVVYWALAGAGLAATAFASLRVLLAHAPWHRHSLALALFAAMVPLAVGLGTGVADALVEAARWPAGFAVPAAGGAIALVLAALAMPGGPALIPPPPDGDAHAEPPRGLPHHLAAAAAVGWALTALAGWAPLFLRMGDLQAIARGVAPAPAGPGLTVAVAFGVAGLGGLLCAAIAPRLGPRLLAVVLVGLGAGCAMPLGFALDAPAALRSGSILVAAIAVGAAFPVLVVSARLAAVPARRPSAVRRTLLAALAGAVPAQLAVGAALADRLQSPAAWGTAMLTGAAALALAAMVLLVAGQLRVPEPLEPQPEPEPPEDRQA